MASFSVPLTRREKLEHVAELVAMTLVDGQLGEHEFDDCATLVMRMGFDEEEAKRLVQAAMHPLSKGDSLDETTATLERLSPVEARPGKRVGPGAGEA
ncbi:MAG: hypothetical protein V3V08_14580 [Nannocystaceae bacterium]